jgi:DNA-binding GntR family transcriptional regulator
MTRIVDNKVYSYLGGCGRGRVELRQRRKAQVNERGGTGNIAQSAAVATSIRNAVYRGEYVAGQRLIEAELCAAHVVSRSVVRSALQELATEGLVEIQLHKGARVRQVSRDEAIEITEVRMVVEGLIAATAARRAGPDQVAELRGIGAAMRRAVAEQDALGYSELNADLHSLIREIAGHRTAATVIERLRGQLVRYQFHLALQPGRPARSLDQHEKIIEAIAAKDPEAAEKAMREHIGDVLAALEALLPA